MAIASIKFWCLLGLAVGLAGEMKQAWGLNAPIRSTLHEDITHKGWQNCSWLYNKMLLDMFNYNRAVNNYSSLVLSPVLSLAAERQVFNFTEVEYINDTINIDNVTTRNSQYGLLFAQMIFDGVSASYQHFFRKLTGVHLEVFYQNLRKDYWKRRIIPPEGQSKYTNQLWAATTKMGVACASHVIGVKTERVMVFFDYPSSKQLVAATRPPLSSSQSCPPPPTCPPKTTCPPLPTTPTRATCPPPPICPSPPTTRRPMTCPPPRTCPPTPTCPSPATPPRITCPTSRPCPICPTPPTTPSPMTCPPRTSPRPCPTCPPPTTCPAQTKCPSCPSSRALPPPPSGDTKIHFSLPLNHCPQNFTESILAKFNAQRRAYNVSLLVLSPAITEAAQNWASTAGSEDLKANYSEFGQLSWRKWWQSSLVTQFEVSPAEPFRLEWTEEVSMPLYTGGPKRRHYLWREWLATSQLGVGCSVLKTQIDRRDVVTLRVVVFFEYKVPGSKAKTGKR